MLANVLASLPSYIVIGYFIVSFYMERINLWNECKVIDTICAHACMSSAVCFSYIIRAS